MKYSDSTSAIFSSDSEDKGTAVTGLQYFINMVLPHPRLGEETSMVLQTCSEAHGETSKESKEVL